MNSTRVADLTVDELIELIRLAVREALQEEREGFEEPPGSQNPQFAILDIPTLDVDPRHPALTILSREDMYGDDER